MRERLADQAVFNANRLTGTVGIRRSSLRSCLSLLPEPNVSHEDANMLRAPLGSLKLERDQPQSHRAAASDFAPVPGDQPLWPGLRCRSSDGPGFLFHLTSRFGPFRRRVAFPLEMREAQAHALAGLFTVWLPSLPLESSSLGSESQTLIEETRYERSDLGGEFESIKMGLRTLGRLENDVENVVNRDN